MIGLALIGCGHFGPKVARSLNAVGGELRVLCDLHPDRFEGLRAHHPRARTTQDYRQAVTDPGVEAVAVCTPAVSHYEIARAALDAGRHVLVEKPLADSLGRAEELAELADRRGVVLHVDHTPLHSAGVRTIRRFIDAGEIGEVRYIDCVRVHLGPCPSDVNVLWDLAPHDLSVVCHLMDRPPRWVSAVGAAHLGQRESQAYVTIGYGDSRIAHLHVNWLAPVKIRSTLVGGSKRTIAYDDLAPVEKIRLYASGIAVRGDGSARADPRQELAGGCSLPVDAGEPLAGVCATFLRAIDTGEAAPTDARAALDVVRILECAQASLAREGERIRLDCC